MTKAITGTNGTLEVGGKPTPVKKWVITTTLPFTGNPTAKRKRLLAKVAKQLRYTFGRGEWIRETTYHLDGDGAVGCVTSEWVMEWGWSSNG